MIEEKHVKESYNLHIYGSWSFMMRSETQLRTSYLGTCYVQSFAPQAMWKEVSHFALIHL